jgi:hypothetical protein
MLEGTKEGCSRTKAMCRVKAMAADHRTEANSKNEIKILKERKSR